jgi:uncharacterized protein RhaS with RHS repeats
VSEDPAGFQAGDSNLYRYVVNSPTNALDPTGLDNFWLFEPWQTLQDIFGSNQRPAEKVTEKKVLRVVSERTEWLLPPAANMQAEKVRQIYSEKFPYHVDYTDIQISGSSKPPIGDDVRDAIFTILGSGARTVNVPLPPLSGPPPAGAPPVPGR